MELHWWLRVMLRMSIARKVMIGQETKSGIIIITPSEFEGVDHVQRRLDRLLLRRHAALQRRHPAAQAHHDSGRAQRPQQDVREGKWDLQTRSSAASGDNTLELHLIPQIP